MAAGVTYTPIATTTLGSATNSVSFNSISASYTDLVVIVNATRPAGFDDGSIIFNSDTGNNYSTVLLRGTGAAASGARYTDYALALNLLYSENQSTNIVHINNYANTNTYKTMLTRANETGNGVRANVTLWYSTAAISSITFVNSGNSNFGSGSTFSLYGITAA